MSGKNLWLSYYVPLASSLFMVVTIERSVTTDGGYDKLYGLPFPFISNNLGCTHCFDVYILNLIIDFAFYLLFVFMAFRLIQQLGIKIHTHRVVSLIGIIICFCWILILYMTVFESSFHFTNNTISYEILSQKLHLGTYPW
jgi:hypothetical protein